MELVQLGWSVFWREHQNKTDLIGRITKSERNLFHINTEKGELLAELSGKLLNSDKESDQATIGDWCQLKNKFTDGSGKQRVLIEKILDRKSIVKRPKPGSTFIHQCLAANVDFAFIVSSANNNLNVNRIRRYCILCKDGGVTPVIVLSKVDLYDNTSELLKNLRTSFKDIDIIESSSITCKGVSAIKKYLTTGITGVFLGSSGVGKSTLVNSLLEEEVQKTKDIRQQDGKGKHTTTGRSLFLIKDAGIIIDTPGLREVGIMGDLETTKQQFKEIDLLEQSCRFSDCQHNNEPGCKINEAKETGVITEEDWKEYQKLIKEQAFINRKQEKVHASKKHKRWREVHMNMKQKKKFGKKNGLK